MERKRTQKEQPSQHLDLSDLTRLIRERGQQVDKETTDRTTTTTYHLRYGENNIAEVITEVNNATSIPQSLSYTLQLEPVRGISYDNFRKFSFEYYEGYEKDHYIGEEETFSNERRGFIRRNNPLDTSSINLAHMYSDFREEKGMIQKGGITNTDILAQEHILEDLVTLGLKEAIQTK